MHVRPVTYEYAPCREMDTECVCSNAATKISDLVALFEGLVCHLLEQPAVDYARNAPPAAAPCLKLLHVIELCFCGTAPHERRLELYAALQNTSIRLAAEKSHRGIMPKKRPILIYGKALQRNFPRPGCGSRQLARTPVAGEQGLKRPQVRAKRATRGC